MIAADVLRELLAIVDKILCGIERETSSSSTMVRTPLIEARRRLDALRADLILAERLASDGVDIPEARA